MASIKDDDLWDFSNLAEELVIKLEQSSNDKANDLLGKGGALAAPQDGAVTTTGGGGGTGPGQPAFAPTPADPKDPRIDIKIKQGEQDRMHEEALQSLIKNDDNIYQRSGELVYITREPEIGKEYVHDRSMQKSILLRPGTPKICTMSRPALKLSLTKTAKWWKPDRKLIGHFNRANVEDDIVKMLLDKTDWPGIKHIAGILETPSFSPDGTLISTPGYDHKTNYLYYPTITIADIPDRPTQQDAADALKFIWTNVFPDFPYKDLGPWDPADTDRSIRYAKACKDCPDAFVAISALLTIIARPAITGPVPGAIFEASSQGSGKSLQIHAIAMIATGRAAGLATFPTGRDGRTNEEELEKILAAYALYGARIIAFDNIKGELGGPAIEKVMTAYQTIDLRVLGLSKIATLPWGATLLCSGNNMSMSSDVAQRNTLSRLEPTTEDPRKRSASEFRHANLLAWIQENRAELVRAALIILRAFFIARAEQRLSGPSWGSFEAWSQVVPLAIRYAGGPDVMATRPTESISEDSEGDAHNAILDNWPPAFNKGVKVRKEGPEKNGLKTDIKRLWDAEKDSKNHADESDDGMKASDIVKYTYENEVSGGLKPNDNEKYFAELRGAFRTLTHTADGKVPGATRLGNALRKLRGKIKHGKKLEGSKHPTDNVLCWQVIDINKPREKKT